MSNEEAVRVLLAAAGRLATIEPWPDEYELALAMAIHALLGGDKKCRLKLE